MTSARLDKILDRTVLAGYTKVGYRIRSSAWSAAELARMDGKSVLITGASSGIGLAAAEDFAGLGARVWLLVRSQERGERARAEILNRSRDADVRVAICDISDLRAVRQFATRFSSQASRLDLLVNNSGALFGERKLSVGGIELTFATNVLGPFLLTNLLVSLLQQSAPARIVNVSSGGMYTQRLHVEDLQAARGRFDGKVAYARSKRTQVILTELWAERLAAAGIVVHAMHPGWADTPGLQSALPGFYKATKRWLRTPQQGADTIVWLGAARAPTRSSGGFWHDRRERPIHRVPWTRETPLERERLWVECERMSGWHPPAVLGHGPQ